MTTNGDDDDDDGRCAIARPTATARAATARRATRTVGARGASANARRARGRRRGADARDAEARGGAVVTRADALPPPAVFDAACAASEKKSAQGAGDDARAGRSPRGALIGFGALLMTCGRRGVAPRSRAPNPGFERVREGRDRATRRG